jgi:solute carrier family 10 (sodium/bile acid cotransporter), member 7
VLHLLLIVALPVAVGQALRRWIPGVLRWRRWLTECSTIALLINLHQAFCLGFSAHGAPGWDVPALGLAMGALHLLIWGGCWAAAGLSWVNGPQRDQRIAMAFCASHKSAALGVPMAGILLRDDPQLGLVLLPVVAYHLAENLLGGVIAARLRRVAPKGGPPGSFPGPPA